MGMNISGKAEKAGFKHFSLFPHNVFKSLDPQNCFKINQRIEFRLFQTGRVCR